MLSADGDVDGMIGCAVCNDDGDGEGDHEGDKADEPNADSGRKSKLFSITSLAPKAFFDSWREDYSKSLQRISTDSTEYHSWATAYRKIRRDQKAMDALTIQRRFHLRNFYLRTVKAGYHNGSSWCRFGSLKLANIIEDEDPSISGAAEIKASLEYIVERGLSYDCWANELGGAGYLIAMPTDCTSFWQIKS